MPKDIGEKVPKRLTSGYLVLAASVTGNYKNMSGIRRYRRVLQV